MTLLFSQILSENDLYLKWRRKTFLSQKQTYFKRIIPYNNKYLKVKIVFQIQYIKIGFQSFEIFLDFQTPKKERKTNYTIWAKLYLLW